MTMKARINLTLDRNILAQIKILAEQKKTSVSSIVESYLAKIIKKEKEQSVLDIISNLEKPSIPDDLDLKRAYYEDKLK